MPVVDNEVPCGEVPLSILRGLTKGCLLEVLKHLRDLKGLQRAAFGEVLK